MLRDMLRRFIRKEAQPLEMKFFTAGELAPEERARLRRAIEQMGLWGLTVPEAYGGGGLDLLSACIIEEELGSTFIPLEIGEVPPVLYACTDEQAKRFLEPALAGERRPIIAAREPDCLLPQGWSATAVALPEGYLLNGQKLVSVPPDPNDFLILYANAADGLTAFLLDASAPGMSVSRDGALIVRLENLRAAGSAVLGRPGGALELGAAEAPRSWIRTGARYVGVVSRLIEMSLEHARNWVSLGEPLSVRPAIQRMLADMIVGVESVRWMMYHAAWQADKNASGDLRRLAASVRLASGELLQRSVDQVTMIFAGPGPAPEIEPQRFVRSLAPPEVLDFALEQARAVIIADMLAQPTQ